MRCVLLLLVLVLLLLALLRCGVLCFGAFCLWFGGLRCVVWCCVVAPRVGPVWFVVFSCFALLVAVGWVCWVLLCSVCLVPPAFWCALRRVLRALLFGCSGLFRRLLCAAAVLVSVPAGFWLSPWFTPLRALRGPAARGVRVARASLRQRGQRSLTRRPRGWAGWFLISYT